MVEASSFYRLGLKDFLALIQLLIQQKKEVIAPQKTDLVRFEPLQDVKDLYFKENSYFPVKEYFFRQGETLFRYQDGKIEVPELKSRERIFFGLRRCDLNGIARQDEVFLHGKHVDPYYQVQREKSLLIGYHCNTAPSKWCFCGSMDLEDFYDIMVWKKLRYYLVHVKTDVGKAFRKRYRKFFSAIDYELKEKDRLTPNTDLLKKKDISEYYDHPDWQKGVDLCLSCSACTALCPTCYCSEHHEDNSLIQIGSGERKREWSSCQLTSFTRVAGDYVFSEKRSQRFKHRIYHQLQYFRDQHGVNLCTGCGRCISGCPTRIDFLSIINGMKEKNKKIESSCSSTTCS